MSVPQGSSPTRRGAAYHSGIELVRRSHAFMEVMKQVDRVANTNLPVLLTGEPGTGKEFVAAAIHHRSDRANKPFIAVNPGAIPADLIELWTETDGGTLFLDQITDTTPAFQLTLLRALQTGEVARSGSNETERVNVRVIAGSDRNVEEEVAAGRLHKDLYSHLNAVSIVLPSLRERPATMDEPQNEEWVPLSEVEGRYVAQVLTHTRGNKQAAARVLAVDRKTLNRMIKRHHIDSEQARRAGR